jgi:LDH2 family malate/lactate/ureidoglycolate dehydrogenase
MNMNTANERVSPGALQQLAESVLAAHGLNADDARDTAAILVLADLFGLSTHGVSRLVSYTDRLRLGGINAQAQIQVQALAPALLRIDADNAVGPLVGHRAMTAAMQAAEQTGVALALVHGSNHFGPVAPYCHLAAQAGFASIMASNATLSITPWGGKQTRLGNNPIGFAVPNPGGHPVVLDMALSVAARAKIRNAAKAGVPIPEGWATDANGQPTTNAAEALKGFLLPVGGHKGYGLAIMVDLIAGLLSGASYLTKVSSWQDDPDKPQDLGHFFLVIDTRRLGSTEWLAERMRDFAQIIHDTPAADPASPVQLPGEREYARWEAQQAQGILIPTDLLVQLRALSASKA